MRKSQTQGTCARPSMRKFYAKVDDCGKMRRGSSSVFPSVLCYVIHVLLVNVCWCYSLSLYIAN